MDEQNQLTHIATLLRPITAEVKAQDWEVTKDTMAKIQSAIQIIDAALGNSPGDDERKRLTEWKFLLEGLEAE